MLRPEYVEDWEPLHVVGWLRERGMQELAEQFAKKEVNGKALLDLTPETLQHELCVLIFGKEEEGSQRANVVEVRQ